jgi:hypothetical protein
MTRRLAVALPALALLSCGLAQSLESRKVLVAVLVRSADVVAAQGVTVSGVTTAQVFFGDRQDLTSGQAPVGIAGATVTVSWTGGTAPVTLPAAPASGWYQLTPAPIPYTVGATYTFTVTSGGQAYTGAARAPSPAAIQELVGAQVPKVFPPQAAATFDHQTITRLGTDVAFYAVNPVGGSSGLGATACTNAPFTDPGALVQLLLDDAAWRVPAFELFRSDRAPTTAQACFAPGTGTHLLSLTTVTRGTTSSNLFLGSGVLVGSTDAGVLVLD